MGLSQLPGMLVAGGRLGRRLLWVEGVSKPAGQYRFLPVSDHRLCGFVSYLVHLVGSFGIAQACPHLRPSFLYPAASLYQLANGIIRALSHGLFIIQLAKDGVDMMAADRMNIPHDGSR